MRQYMTERKQQQRSSALRDMVAPLHVSVSTATTAMSHEAPEIKSKFMKNVGKLLQDLLTRFWIAVVAIMLFICGITGERMTMFRIVYMSLFLIFVITFQVSHLSPGHAYLIINKGYIINIRDNFRYRGQPGEK